jgi:apolipoprotein N-acyltransferase
LTRPIILAACAGVCHFLGFVGFGLWPLAFISLPLLWQALDSSPRRLLPAAVLGFVFGWVSYAGGYFWLWHIVDVFLAGHLLLGAVVWLADSIWFALRYALYATLYVGMRRRGASVALSAVPTLLLVEWCYPLLFPVHFGHLLTEQTRFIQMSDVGGPLLLSAFAAGLSVCVRESWRWFRGGRSRPTVLWLCALLATISAWIYGTVRIADVEANLVAAPKLRVGIVQGNLGVQEKGRQSERDHRVYLEQTRALLSAEEVDLVVWPETVFTRGLRGPLPVSGELIRADVHIPLLFGAVFVGVDDNQPRAYNAALLVGADGVIRDVYRKNLLVPFTEFVPFADRLPSLAEYFADASHFAAAGDVPALSLGAWRIATPICYEVVRPAFVRRMVNEAHPHLIVTLANDAWFGESQGAWLHLAMAKLRAVEQRRYLVRATNSGVSAIVDPAGRIVAQTGLLTRETLSGTVALLDHRTVYARCGDWAGWLAAVVVLVALLKPRRV